LLSISRNLISFFIFLPIYITLWINPAFSKTSYITLTLSAKGTTEEMAINNALLDALSQINGTTISGDISIQEFEKSITKNNSSSYYLSEEYSRDINKYTEGIIKDYKILNSSLEENGWRFEASVTIAKYALSPQANRKRIAVMPFRITDTRDLIVQNRSIDKRRVLGLLNQSLVSYFTQTRKFFVADRDFVEELYAERDFIEFGNVPLEELSKLGNDLGVDLILVGVIEDFNTKYTKKDYPSLNKTFVSTKGVVEISYRIIDVPTRQIKYANLYLSDSGTTSTNADTQMILDAVSTIGEDILFAIYPLRVEKIDGDILYIGQGGNQLNKGDIYEVFRVGEDLIDSYTGESLGGIEEYVGTAEITNVTAKMSIAKFKIEQKQLLDGNSNLILRNKKDFVTDKLSVADKINDKSKERKENEDEIW